MKALIVAVPFVVALIAMGIVGLMLLRRARAPKLTMIDLLRLAMLQAALDETVPEEKRRPIDWSDLDLVIPPARRRPR